MIKVINLVSLIFAPIILKLAEIPALGGVAGFTLLLVIVMVVWYSKREGAFTRI